MSEESRDVAVVEQPQTGVLPVEMAVHTYRRMAEFVKEIMREDIDFGVIPGTGSKPSLYLAGAEKLAKLFRIYPEFEIVEKVERWDRDDPLFYYQICCILHEIGTDVKVGEGVGSANSREDRYAYRWVEEKDALAMDLDLTDLEKRASITRVPDFALKNRETPDVNPQYGKPEEEWDRLQALVDAGKIIKQESRGNWTMYTLGTTRYRVPNPEIYSLINTILKMAKKRAYVDAVSMATMASEFFTQDLEDIKPVAEAAVSPEDHREVPQEDEDGVPNRAKLEQIIRTLEPKIQNARHINYWLHHVLEIPDEITWGALRSDAGMRMRVANAILDWEAGQEEETVEPDEVIDDQEPEATEEIPAGLVDDIPF